jgi:hypothetical protein
VGSGGAQFGQQAVRRYFQHWHRLLDAREACAAT